MENSESTAWNPESNTVLDNPTWGSGVMCNSCLFINNIQEGADRDQQENVHRYDIPEFNDLVSKRGLIILHQNIKDLLANKSNICQILGGFKNIYILSVSETHLPPRKQSRGPN